MTSVTNVNNMNILEFTLNCFLFIVRSAGHIHRKNTLEKKVCESTFCGLKAYKLLMKERQFRVSTLVVAKGKFRNGGKEKRKGERSVPADGRSLRPWTINMDIMGFRSNISQE